MNDGREIAMKCFVQPDQIPWLTLDAVTGSYLKNIFTIKDDNAEVTCVFQKQEKGFAVPVHTHEEEHSAYLMSGRVTVWIEGVGEFTATAGCLVRIPTGLTAVCEWMRPDSPNVETSAAYQAG